MISVVMITRNEERAAAKVIADVRAAVPRAEILVVDSSDDDTAAVAAAAGARVIRQYPARGYGPALDLGLRQARGEVTVTLDCDDTYPAALIPALAAPVLAGDCDLVDGSRLAKKPAAMPWLNYLGNRFFALLATILCGRGFTDLHSGMRAYRRGLAAELDLDPVPPALPVALLLAAVRRGRRVRTRFIPYRERIGASTLRPWSGAWWTLRRILAACR